MKNSSSDYKDFKKKFKIKVQQVHFKIILLQLHQKDKRMPTQLIPDQL